MSTGEFDLSNFIDSTKPNEELTEINEMPVDYGSCAVCQKPASLSYKFRKDLILDLCTSCDVQLRDDGEFNEIVKFINTPENDERYPTIESVLIELNVISN